jgi:tetratricopeptide (TPR) repeat protein
MRNAWLTKIAAIFCITALAATSAVANPASMAMRPRPGTSQESSSFWPWSKKTAPSAPQAQVVQPMTERPTDHISATQHPIKYLKAAVSEMPIGSKGKVASAQRNVVKPAQAKPEAPAPSTPTGPPSPEFFIFAAQACERQGDVPQARANLQRALKMWPGHVEVLRSAARMEDRQGNLPLAENLYQQAVNSNPQHAGALNDLGLCMARQGKLEPSLRVIEQAIQLQPGKALYRNNAATILVEMRYDQKALAHLAAVHGPAEANYNLGQLLVDRGRPADATRYYQAALQQNPDMQPAQIALAKLQGAPIAVSVPPATAAPVATGSPQVTMPVGEAVAPQQEWTGPQINYPATAQGPSTGATSYARPQYLPPVATRPGAPRR